MGHAGGNGPYGAGSAASGPVRKAVRLLERSTCTGIAAAFTILKLKCRPIRSGFFMCMLHNYCVRNSIGGFFPRLDGYSMLFCLTLPLLNHLHIHPNLIVPEHCCVFALGDSREMTLRWFD